MPRIGTLKKLGNIWVKKAKPHGRIGGKLPKWYPDDPLHIRSQAKGIIRTAIGKEKINPYSYRARTNIVRKPIIQTKTVQQYPQKPYLRRKKTTFKEGEQGLEGFESYATPDNRVVGYRETEVLNTKEVGVRRKPKRTKPYEHIIGRDYKYAGKGRGAGNAMTRFRQRPFEEPYIRPKPRRVKPALKPTRTQEALVQLRAAEKGPSALTNPQEGMESGRDLMQQFQPGQQETFGRLNEYKNIGDQNPTKIPRDYPIGEAREIATAQAMLPKGERTLIPETQSIPEARVLQGMEGGQPQFVNRKYQPVGPKAENAAEQIGRTTQAGTVKAPIEKVIQHSQLLETMWSSIGGLRSIEGRKWKNFLGNVFGRGNKNPKNTPEAAFYKVGLEWMDNPSKASKKYPRALIISLERALEVYRGSI